MQPAGAWKRSRSRLKNIWTIVAGQLPWMLGHIEQAPQYIPGWRTTGMEILQQLPKEPQWLGHGFRSDAGNPAHGIIDSPGLGCLVWIGIGQVEHLIQEDLIAVAIKTSKPGNTHVMVHAGGIKKIDRGKRLPSWSQTIAGTAPVTMNGIETGFGEPGLRDGSQQTPDYQERRQPLKPFRIQLRSEGDCY